MVTAEMMTTTTIPSNEDVLAFSKLIRRLSTDCHSLLTSSTTLLPSHLYGSSSSHPNPSPSDPFLTLKSLLLLSYTQHLFLLSSHRALGLSLVDDPQGKELVQRLVRMRVTLDKMKLLEVRLKPKWERLVRAAQTFKTRRTSGDREDSSHGEDGGRTRSDEDEGDKEEEGDLDPLAFRPNPSALLGSTSKSTPAAPNSTSNHKARSKDNDDNSETSSNRTGVYRPPKLAPMPYSDRPPRSKSRRGGDVVSSDEDEGAPRGSHRSTRGLNSHLLSDLQSSLSSNPHSTSSTGLTSLSSLSTDPTASSRAKRLREMDEYEENNFTRLVLSKKDERKRRRDEEDVVLGGVTTAGLSSSRKGGGGEKVGAGLEEEFGDLLRGGERRGHALTQSRKEWERLTRQRKTALPVGQSQGRRRNNKTGGGASGNRFEKAVASQTKKRR